MPPFDDTNKPSIPFLPDEDDNNSLVSSDVMKTVEEIVTQLNFCLSGTLIYPLAHPAVNKAVSGTMEVLTPFIGNHTNLILNFVNEEVLFRGESVLDGSHLAQQFYKLFHEREVFGLVINRGLVAEELKGLIAIFREGSRDDKPTLEALIPMMNNRNITHITLQAPPRNKSMQSGSRFEIARTIYEKGSRLLESSTMDSVDSKRFDVQSVRPVVQELIDSLMEDESALLAVTSLKNFDNYLYNHCMNVCVLSLCFAMYLKLEHHWLMEIGIGALLHDIGKIRLPMDILHKPSPLTESEWKLMRQHPVEGARMIMHSRYCTELPMMIVFGHHWRPGADGYPVTKRNIHLHPIVAMVSVCDCYDAMTTSRPYGRVYLPSGALTTIKQTSGTQYDPEIISFFEKMLGPYPIGSLVKLDTGDIGIVLRHNQEDVHRPHVKIMQDANGNLLTDIVIHDLTEKDDDETQYLRSIVSSVDPATVSFNVWECL